MKLGRVQFLKPVNIPHYNTVEGLTWKDHNHELDLEYDGSVLVVRGMPERLNGRIVEVSVPSTNIASFLSMEAELEWSKENERIKVEAEEEARHKRQEARDAERKASRSGSNAPAKDAASGSGSKKEGKGSGVKKAGTVGGASKK
jgi:hypothetical protein